MILKVVGFNSQPCQKYFNPELQKSGWYSGKMLDFHPSNPGLTPARVKAPQKKYKKIIKKNRKTT